MPTRTRLAKWGLPTGLLCLFLAPLRAGAVPPPPIGPVVVADNQFAFRLFHLLTTGAGPGANTFVAPSSVAVALAMAYSGAGGATRAAMAGALSLRGLSAAQVGAENAALRDALRTADPAVRLTVANDLWADTGTRFDPTFARSARRDYGAGVTTLRLDSRAAAVINARVGEETQGLIPDLLSPQDLSPPVRAVLTDAVYFHGRWSEPFDKAATHPGTFARAGGRPKSVPMMARTGEMEYLRADGFQAVHLPYGRGRFTLAVLLPARASSLPALLKKLDAAHWQALDSKLSPQTVDLTLPRFKVSVTSALNGPLTALGMGIAFTRHADFRPMASPPLMIGKVQQKALLDVDEQGTTAAAATAVTLMPTAVRPLTRPAVMRVDRPFLCVLQDSGTGAILFLGAITDPQ